MNTGIYEILNTVNGKWYRGQARGQTIAQRWSDHKRRLRNGKHDNNHLQRAWDKYKEDAFTFRVLSRCAPEFCNEMEAYWIGEDYNNRDVSYNMKAGGDVNTPSEETKHKMSEARRGDKHPMYGKTLNEEHKAKIGAAHKGAKNYQYAPFIVCFPDGRIDRWETTHEAAAAYGVSYNAIWSYLNGKRTPGNRKSSAHLKGCIFEYITL